MQLINCKKFVFICFLFFQKENSTTFQFLFFFCELNFILILKSNEHVSCTNNADEALLNADFIVHTIPVQSTTEYLKRLKDKIPKTLPIISASKGFRFNSIIVFF